MNILRSKLFCLLVLAFLYPLGGLVAQDDADTSLDSLFSGDGEVDSDANSDGDSGTAPEKIQPVASAASLRIKASMDATLFFTAGLRDLSKAADLTGNAILLPGFSFVPALELDARVRSGVRLYSKLNGTIVQDRAIDWNNFGLAELFMDYTMADAVFFRLGKFASPWGKGQLLNPANFMDGTDSAFKLRGNTAIEGLSLTGFGLVIPDSNGTFNMKGLRLAGMVDGASGPVELGLAGDWQYQTQGRASAFVRVSLDTVDFTLEPYGIWNASYAFSYGGLVQLLWKESWMGFKLGAEYQFKVPDGATPEHLVAMGVKLDAIPGAGFRPGLEWRHSFADSSGRLLGGITVPMIESLSLDCGLAWNYGDGSRLAIPDDQVDPEKRNLLLILTLRLGIAHEAWLKG